MKAKNDRCTGHCCTFFFLPFSPEELQAAYYRWNKGNKPLFMNAIEPADKSIYTDIHLIAPMAEYIGYLPETTRPTVNPSDSVLIGEPKSNHYYRCKHFDAKKKLCTIYEMRPAMCKDYPYGRPCVYAGCTWKSHKEKKQTKREISKRLKVLQDGEANLLGKGGER